MTNQKPPTSLLWVELALKVIGLLETLLPAFLVAYNAELKSKLHAARSLAEIAEAQRRADAKAQAVQESAKGLGRRALLDRALARRPGAKPPAE